MSADTLGSGRAAPAPVVAPRLHVHVAGAVRQPGLYQADAGARVADLVDAAGGPSELGDLDRLNLAQLVQDGDRIEVPEVGRPLSGAANTAAPDDGTVNVNRAGASELQQLPGIGPALAAAIVEHRERFGPFATVDALTAVSGIGPATVARLAERARV